jgi:hypothetical protein
MYASGTTKSLELHSSSGFSSIRLVLAAYAKKLIMSTLIDDMHYGKLLFNLAWKMR